MMHDVLLQGGAYLKHLSAFVAFKLLDVGVVELTMLPQVCLLAKAQAASFTYERLLSSATKISVWSQISFRRVCI